MMMALTPSCLSGGVMAESSASTLMQWNFSKNISGLVIFWLTCLPKLVIRVYQERKKDSKMAVTFLNIDTMTEEPGTFLRYVGPFKARIKAATGEIRVVDIDDFWAV
jgi:hypothetical protein